MLDQFPTHRKVEDEPAQARDGVRRVADAVEMLEQQLRAESCGLRVPHGCLGLRNRACVFEWRLQLSGKLDWKFPVGVGLLGFPGGLSHFQRIPTGFHHSAQGCESASYPGASRRNFPSTLKGLQHGPRRIRRQPSTRALQPLQGWANFAPRSQGSSRTRNPGLSAPILSGLKSARAPVNAILTGGGIITGSHGVFPAIGVSRPRSRRKRKPAPSSLGLGCRNCCERDCQNGETSSHWQLARQWDETGRWPSKAAQAAWS